MIGRGFERSGEASGANACFEGPAIYVINSNEELFCRFDFSAKFSGKHLAAAEGHPTVGTFINHPARRVIGRHRPDVLGGWQDSDPAAYRAIHVHEYDLTDAAWGETVRFTIPQDMRSGIYAIDVVAEEGGQLRLPFVVRASPGKESPTLYLLPTNTYIAYANERLAFGERAEALASEVDGITLSVLDKTLDAQPELGASLYDRHTDGSGVMFSSRRRPILNLSPDYTAWWCTGAPRHFLADLNITSWLDHTGEGYDIATDEDLHKEGHELLKKYRVLVTGTHPEYATAQMMRALHAFKEIGRHLYLGANGFYWVTAYDPEDTAVVECRRGFAGTRNWTSDPLEIRLAMTGETGGLWRHRGLAPQSLTGIGFAAVGFTKASGYMRCEASKAEYATLFAGIDEDIIGDFGDILGGAAGDELDATDTDLGTPSTTVVLAYSKHGRSYLPVVEDQIEIQNAVSGENNAMVRSEITITEWPAGGRTFSAGAINWCGSLAFNGYKNSICRLATNVLRAFLV
jgi:N,N-dimethylformamidase